MVVGSRAVVGPHTAAALAAAFLGIITANARGQGMTAFDAPPPAHHGDRAHDPLRENHRHEHEQDDKVASVPAALRANLLEGWLDDWPHAHASRRGTPFVHTFGGEPAFLGRELFLDYSFTRGEEGTEMEIEAELEHAITRRIGIVVEAPYAVLDPDDATREHGIGDVAVAPRFLLLDYDRFLLAANVELSFPTGESKKGLGTGEAAISPSISTWHDLGMGLTLHTSLGVTHGFCSDDHALTWGSAVVCSIGLFGQIDPALSDDTARARLPSGLLSLIAEVRGEHPLSGEEKGSGSADWILGASYTITPHVEVRGALSLPAWSPSEFDQRVILGLVIHF
jgi:hypothetical protein